MRQTYVRFVTPIIDEDSGRRRGVFQAVAELVDANELPPHDAEALQSIRNWFNQHMEAPDRFARSDRKNAAPKAISWFKTSAAEHVRQMHEMCRIVNEYGVPTEMITSARPGYVVFEDEHQIGAVPFADTVT